MTDRRVADLNWQDSKDMHEANLYMLDNEILCDVSFLVGCSDKESWEAECLAESFPPLVYKKLLNGGVRSASPRKILAHKFILVARSSVFESLFLTSMAESRQGMNDPISVVDIEPDTFKEILQYLYLWNKAEINKETVYCLWYAARKYLLPGLETLCVKHLLNNLSHTTVCETLEHCLFFDSDQLNVKQHCLRIICMELSHISQQAEFLEISHRALHEIVSQNRCGVTEIQLYLICMDWAKAEARRLHNEVSVKCKTCDAVYKITESDLSQISCISVNSDVDSSKSKLEECSGVKRKSARLGSSMVPLVKRLRNNWQAGPSACSLLSPCRASTDSDSACNITQSADSVKQERDDNSEKLNCDAVQQDVIVEGSTTKITVTQESVSQDLNFQISTSSNSDRDIISTVHSLTAKLFHCGHIKDENLQKRLFVVGYTDEVSETVCRQILGDIIYRIRFSTMPQELFAQTFGLSAMLTGEEKAAIYYDMIMRNKGLHYVPSDGSKTFDREKRRTPVVTAMNRFNTMTIDLVDNDCTGGRYLGRSRLSFKVNRPIILTTLGFYTGITSDCRPFRVELSIKLDGMALTTCDTFIQPRPDAGGVDNIRLQPSCYILENAAYEIDFTIHGSRGSRFFGQSGSEKCHVDEYGETGTEFQFEHLEGSTNVVEGQLASLGYRYLPAH